MKINSKNISVLARLYEISGIPVCITDSRKKILIRFPKSGVPLLNDRMIANCFKESKNQNKYLLVLAEENIYFIGFSKLNAIEYLIFGPAAQSRGYRFFTNVLSTAIFLLSEIDVSPEDIILSNTAVFEKETETEILEQLYYQKEDPHKHTPQSFETGVLEAVEAGDITLLKKRLTEPVNGRIGKMAKIPLMQERYTFIAFATLLTRAAIKGGLDNETAFSFSDTYCLRMDSMTRVQDISALQYNMALDFCRKVANEGGGIICSSRIQKIRSYISSHLHEEIKFSELPAVCGLGLRSLSLQFRKELGLSIPDYIHRQKMKEAAHLLKYSNYEIAGIAEFLKYSSQSYFTKVFHEVYKFTPKQYREKYQMNG